MEEIKINYCRLEIHKWIDFNERKINSEQKSIIWQDRVLVYVENYSNYILLKKRVLQLTEIWFASITNPRDNKYPSFKIFNSQQDFA